MNVTEFVEIPEKQRGTLRGESRTYVRFRDPTDGASKRRWLGPWGSDEAERKYAEFVQWWLKAHNDPRAAVEASVLLGPLTIRELIADYAEELHRSTKVYSTWMKKKAALDRFNVLFGPREAGSIRRPDLNEYRKAMAEDGCALRSINEFVRIVINMFTWAGDTKDEAYDDIGVKLSKIKPLVDGDLELEASEPIEPVPAADLEAVRKIAKPHLLDMIDVQLACGMRPGELTAMCWADIQQTDRGYLFKPGHHKTKHKGKHRAIPIFPEALAILMKYKDRPPTVPIFSPLEIEVERYAREFGRDRDETRAKLKAKKRGPKARYYKGTYRNAILRACKRAGVTAWSPNQLRHTRATEIAKKHGDLTATKLLGHSSVAVTRAHYIQATDEEALDIMNRVG